MTTDCRFEKDPNAVLDYMIDWTDWIGADTINTSTWTVEDGITKGADSNTTTTATVWLSGGADGETYRVTNKIVTTGSRTDERSIFIVCKEL